MSRRQHHGHGHGSRGPRQDAGRGYRPPRPAFEGPVQAESRPPQPTQSAPDAAVASAAAFRPPIVPPRPVQPAPGPLNGIGEESRTGESRNGDGAAPSATAPQFRRFIKSRAYVPMHELRRRFGINGMEDEVTPVAIDGGYIYVGLPAREGNLLGELLRAGDVGYELSLDPCTPVVIGIYPMRPVPRH